MADQGQLITTPSGEQALVVNINAGAEPAPTPTPAAGPLHLFTAETEGEGEGGTPAIEGSIDESYLSKLEARDDAQLRREGQALGYVTPDPDPFAEASKAFNSTLPQLPEAEKAMVENGITGEPLRPGATQPAPAGTPVPASRTWADDLGDYLGLEATNAGPVSEVWKAIARTGVASFRGFSSGTESFFQSLDDLATSVADATGLPKGGLFNALAQASDYWVKQSDKLYDLSWDKRARNGQILDYNKFLAGMVGDIVGGALPGMASFVTDKAGLAAVKGYARDGITGAVTDQAKTLMLGHALDAAQSLPYVLRAAGMGGMFAADAYSGGETDPTKLAAAVGTGAGMAAMTPQAPPKEIRPVTPYEAAQVDNLLRGQHNLEEIKRAEAGGEVSPKMAEMLRYFAHLFPDRDAATSLRVVNELMQASDAAMAAAGMPGQPGRIVGGVRIARSADALKAALELYQGADVGTVIHENAHLFFDKMPAEAKAGLQEWYERETAGQPDKPIFDEFVAEKFTGWFLKNKLWLNPASRADGFGGYFGQAANRLRTFLDKVMGVDGAMPPRDVLDLFRQAATGESGDVFSGATFKYDLTPVESYQTKAEKTGEIGAKVYSPGDVVAKIDEATARELWDMGFKTQASNVVIPEKTIAYFEKKIQEGRLKPEDVAKIQDVIENHDEVLPNLPEEGKEYRASSVLFAKKMGRGQVAIVEATPGEDANILWNTFKLRRKNGDDYLKQFRQEKARRQQPGGAASIAGVPSYSSQQADGQAGKPESLSGSQTAASSKENIATPVPKGKTSFKVEPLSPAAQWENLRSWEKVGDESRPWEIVDKAAGAASVITNDKNIFGQTAHKAVNINLDRLKTGDDIKRVIAQVGEALRPEMDEARRYTRSDALVKGDALRLLADDVGMTEATLLQRRRGEAFNAEQAVAARMILVSSADDVMRMAKDIQAGNNSDASLLAFRQRVEAHAAIQAQVSGMAAEAGRALRSFRILAGSSAVAPDIKLRPDDISKIVEATGGRGGIQKLADTLTTLAETGENSVTQVGKAIEDARKRTFKDWVLGYRYAAMLSGIPTHVRNSLGNALVATMAVPERFVASQLGIVSKWLGSTNPEHVQAQEAGALLFGYLHSQVEALSLAGDAFRTGQSQFGPQKVEEGLGLKTATTPVQKIGDFLWDAMSVPTRVLGAEDEYFKAINYRAELSAQAYRQASMEGLNGDALAARVRELMITPSEEMQRRSLDAAKIQTFNQDLTGPMRDISRGISSSFIGRVFVPFLRTPWNIFQYTMARTPLAPVFADFRADWSAGGARAEMALSKMIVGSSLMSLATALVANGTITGGGPSSKGERNVWLQNCQPYSIKFGDTWYSYGNLAEPISTYFALAADYYDAMTDWKREWDQGKVSPWELSTALVKAFAKNLTDKTFLKGVADLAHALDDPDRYAASWLQSLAGSFVPSFLGNWANSMDPELKLVGGYLDAMLNRVPGAKSDLPPRRDIFGEPVVMHTLGPAWMSPIRTKDDSDVSDIEREMLRLGMRVSMPRKDQTFQAAGLERGVNIELTPEEYSRLLDITGHETRFGNLKARLDDYVNAASYQRMAGKSDGPDGQAAASIASILRDAREMAKMQLLQETPRLQGRIRDEQVNQLRENLQ